MSIISLSVSTYRRGALAWGAPARALPASAQSRRWSASPSAIARCEAALFGIAWERRMLVSV